jgi:dynein heavy chain
LYVEPYSNESLKNIFTSVLDWNFQSATKFSYEQDIIGMKANIVEATIAAYQNTIERFKPTPSKSHYTYNLRDVSKVFQGISKSDPRAINEKDKMIKLWMHECMRVFHDRLISQGDRSEFIEMLQETLTAKFKRKIGKGELEHSNPLVFGSFIPTVP